MFPAYGLWHDKTTASAAQLPQLAHNIFDRSSVMSLVQTVPSLAKSTTCFPCRRSRRRCDRSLPICQLCIRKGTGCRYPIVPVWPGDSVEHRADTR